MADQSPYAALVERMPVQRSELRLRDGVTACWTYGPPDATRTVVFLHGLRGDHHGLEPIVSHLHGVRVVVDPVSLPYLEGSVVDYKDGLIGAGFSFDNPNVAATCGCNSSFQAKDGIEGPYSPKPGNGCA